MNRTKMNKPITITTANIDKLIQSIKFSIRESNGGVEVRPQYMIFPRTIRGELDRKKYKGRGRPRRSDYKRIPFPKYLPNKVSSAFEII